MKKILVTGANGQVGQELQALAGGYPDSEFSFVTRNTFNLEDMEQMLAYLNQAQPNCIINCAAYTAVDRAESEPEKADVINHQAVDFMARWCASNNSTLLHLSTDYVFDGASEMPYTEADATNPQSVYGKTKRAGEKAILNYHPEAIIIRTAWVYSSYGSNFVKTILRLMQERESLNIVNDQVGSPTYAADLARVILKIINESEWKKGIYHYSNIGRISWYTFAEVIREEAGLECKLNGISSSAYTTAAQRPAYSLLDTSKLQRTYGIQIPEYRSSLRQCLKKLI